MTTERIERWSIQHPTVRYRAGKLLELLSRNEKLGSATKLDEFETQLMAQIMRDYLSLNSPQFEG